MKYLKYFESKNYDNWITTYHGGDHLDNNNIYVPIFTTTDIKGTEHYITWGKTTGYLTTLKVKINKPLCKDGFLPILEELNFKYKLDNEFGYLEEIYDGEKYYKVDSLLDIVFKESFIEVAKKHGYDGIIDDDVYFQTTIEVYIPFYKENIHVVSSKHFDEIKHIYD